MQSPEANQSFSSETPIETTSAHLRELLGPAIALFVTFFCLYSLFAPLGHFGYEGGNIEQLEAILRGTTEPREKGGIRPFARGGALDVAGYLPFAVVSLALQSLGTSTSVANLIYIFALPFWTAVFCAVSFGFFSDVFRSVRLGIALTLILGACTMVWPYAQFGMETHQSLWTVATVWALLRYSRVPTRSAAAVIGASLGMLILTKITGCVHAALLYLAVLWVCVYHAQQRTLTSRQIAAHLIFMSFPAAIGVILFLLSNKYRYGNWIWGNRYLDTYIGSPVTTVSALLAYFASPGKSVFLFNPPLIFGLFFVRRFWRELSELRPALLALTAAAVMHLALHPWTDETWGPRRLHFLIPFLLLPVGVGLKAIVSSGFRAQRLAHFALIILLLAGAYVQLIASAFGGMAYINTLSGSRTFYQESIIWNPGFSMLKFQTHLAASWAAKKIGKNPAPFIFDPYYMPWAGPKEVPPPEVYDISGKAKLGVWWLSSRGAGAIGGSSISAKAIVPLLMLGLIAGLFQIAMYVRGKEPAS